MFSRRGSCLAVTFVLIGALTHTARGQTDRAEFFETRIRPVIVQNCYGCHTQAESGGLRLDSRERILRGGRSGAAIVPGNPGNSLLIQAVEQTHPRLKMPPQGRLKAAEIADLRVWIEGGAIWPEQPAAITKSTITAEQRAFWSFQPVRTPVVPHPKNKRWAGNNIDRFLLARMEAEGLKPAEPADKRTLLRRVTYDLTGLPPTPEEVAAFLADQSRNAYQKVVDRLLASPRYGERWARHWLDLARYSDGQQGARDDTPYANAFRYRDWVIDAFNRDLPYDVFVKAQIAADQMPLAERESLLPGLGFQALGESDGDRVDVTTRVFLGLTVACAQCHDHKFDPIPTRDYYSLLGVFRSSREEEYPLVNVAVVEAYKKAKTESEEKKAELKRFEDLQVSEVVDILASQTRQYVNAAWRMLANPSLKSAEAAAPESLDRETLERWLRYLRHPDEKEHKTFARWNELMRRVVSPKNARESEVDAVAHEIHTAVEQVLAEKKAIDDRNYVKLGGIEGMKDTGKVIATLVEALPIEKYYLWRDLASKPYKVEDLKFEGGIYHYTPKEVVRFLSPGAKRYLETLRSESAVLEKAIPPAYPFWHVLKDVQKPENLHVAIRGDASNLGEEAPRRFLSILCDHEPAPFRLGSGRMELADAIASPGNPLTARVMVNRLWKEHFGYGIVRTASNFGQLGERPTHPELLDYLAARFVESGWSIKALHREMLLSAAYQMSSNVQASAAAKDPENRLLSHAYAWERMDAESERDSILAVAGTLDLKTGGPSQPLTDEFHRRAIYATVSRSKPDRMMAVFDFPDPNSTSEQRMITVGPMQRLFFLNSRFVAQQCNAFAQRVSKEMAGDSARITRTYQILFDREPTAEELRLGLEFVHGKPELWPQYAQVLMATAEFNAIP